MKRLVSKKTVGNRSIKVYRDTDWNEFLIQFFENGQHQADADYHTDDAEDARDTAGKWLSGSQSGLGEAVPVIGATPTTAPAAPTANAAPASQGAVQSKPMTTQGVEALAQVIKNAGLTPSQLSTVTTLARK